MSSAAPKAAVLYLVMFAPGGILSPAHQFGGTQRCNTRARDECIAADGTGRSALHCGEMPASRRPESRLRRRFHFHFGVEVGNDILEGGDRLLNGSDLHQFPAANRAVALLQRDNQIPPLLLELNKR